VLFGVVCDVCFVCVCVSSDVCLFMCCVFDVCVFWCKFLLFMMFVLFVFCI